MTLMATSGLQRGQCAKVSGHVSIGTGVDDTVRLLDRDAIGHRADLYVGRYSVQVIPRDGNICLNGVPCSKPTRVLLSRKTRTTLDFGPVGVELRRNPVGQTGRALAVITIAMIVLVLGITMTGPTISAATSATTSAFKSPDFAVSPLAGPVPRVTIDDLIARELVSRDLADVIAINFAPDNAVITATGTVDDGQMARFRNFLQWYDGVPGGPVINSTVIVTTPQHADIPDISMVTLAPARQIFDMSGRAFNIGDVMPGGWQIGAITDVDFTLTNNGRTHVIAMNTKGARP